MKKITEWAKAHKINLRFKGTKVLNNKTYGIYSFAEDYELWHTVAAKTTYEIHRANSDVAMLVTNQSDEIIEYISKNLLKGILAKRG